MPPDAGGADRNAKQGRSFAQRALSRYLAHDVAGTDKAQSRISMAANNYRPKIAPPRMADLQEQIDAGLNISDMSRSRGVSRRVIANWLDFYGLVCKWQRATARTPDQIARIANIKAMYAAGDSYYAIARANRCSYSTVHKALNGEPEPVKPVLVVRPVQRSKPSAEAFFFANPFGQAVGNVAEGADAFDGHGSTLPV